MDRINPSELGTPRGWTNGLLAPARSRILFVAGQTATDAAGRVTDAEFVAQFDAALAKVMTVVRSAGGRPEDVARMTVYVSDLDAYRDSRKALAEVWRGRMGRHYPAMTLVEVRRLVDEGAMVEIDAVAVLPESSQ